MKTQIALMIDGVKHFTFFGSDFIANKYPNTNVVPMSDVIASKAIQMELKKYNGGKNWNVTPVLETDYISRVGKYAQAEGDITLDGMVYHVTLTANGYTWEPDPDAPVKEEVVEETPNSEHETKVEEVPELEPVVEEAPTPEPVVEETPEPDVKEVPTSEPVVEATPEPEPIVEEPGVMVEPEVEEAPKPVVEETLTSVSTPEPVVEEVKPIVEETLTSVPTPEPESIVEQEARVENCIASGKAFPESKPVEVDQPKTGGIMFGNNRNNRQKLGLNIGSPDYSNGINFHSSLPEPNVSDEYRSRRKRLGVASHTRMVQQSVGGRRTLVSNTKAQAPQPRVQKNDAPSAAPVLTPVITPIITPPKLPEKLVPVVEEEVTKPAWKSDTWSRPVPKTEIAPKARISIEKNVEPEETIEEKITEPIKVERREDVPEETVLEETPAIDLEARKAAKEAVRATLPEDVNAVIGDIPVEMLTSIPEFTSSPVDVDRLNNERDLYCIDNRWHKQGKWFCIDVVCNTARYFFNSKLGVSIEIPIKYCRAWHNVIS